MNWIESITKAINYIEENLTEDLAVDAIADHACLSTFYFQKGFAMLCGFTVGEYIRKRRLSLAGQDLLYTDHKIIEIALKYGYDSPDSFAKAFIRFHKVTPSAVRRDGAMIKTFVPLKVNLLLKGGYTMDYKIVKKDAFKVVGVSKVFKYENATKEVPKFWDEFFQKEMNESVCGLYGINMDKEMAGNEFEYMIADNYDENKEVPAGCITKVIPAHTWAIFACIGDSKKVLPKINQQIFSEWLPNSKEYEIAEGYNIELYTDPSDLPNGVCDEKYYSEIWIPVKKA